MFKVQQNRYLWVHLVGLAAVPLLLDICLAGLASARPAFDYAKPFGVQFWVVAIVGVMPSLWMQIQKPFYIYSLPPLAVNPGFLSEDDRRCLTVLKSWQIKALAGATAVFSVWLLAQLYSRLPQTSSMMSPGVGLVSAIASFFFACLFLQISVSVVRSLLISQDTLQRVTPFDASEIDANFLIPGLRISQILPTEPITPDIPISTEPPERTNIKAPPPVEEMRESEAKLDNSTAEIADANDTEIESQTEETVTPPTEVTTEMPPEDPPLVIPEIIESDE